MKTSPVVPTFTQIAYTNKKADQNIWKINWDDIPVLEIKDQQLIYFDPGTTGGNHKHPRTEWYLAFGSLRLYWLDNSRLLHRKKLNPKGKLLLVTIPPFLPHAVFNYSTKDSAILLELADGPQLNVEKIKVR